MRRSLPAGIFIRVLLPFLVIIILGIGIWPYAAQMVLLREWEISRSQTGIGETQTAAGAFARTAGYLPWRAGLWEQAGHLAYVAGDNQSAVAYYSQAHRRGEITVAGMEELGNAFQRTMNLGKAIALWQEALIQGGDPLSLHRSLLDAFWQQEDYAAAAQSLQVLLQYFPEESQLHYQMGLVLASEDPETAAGYFKRAAQLDQNYQERVDLLLPGLHKARVATLIAQKHLETGRALALVKEWALSVRAFRMASEALPGWSEPWAYLGEALQHSEKPGAQDAAYVYLQRAVEIDPQSVTANTFMALYWQRRGKNALALPYLQVATNIEPQNHQLQVELGGLLARMGKLDMAYQAYRTAVEMAPRNAAYYRLLAGFSVQYEYKIRTIGLPAARRAVALRPGDPAVLNTMAQVLIVLEDDLNAERFLQRALKIEPDFALAHLNLGVVYALRGQKGRALAEWNRARSQAADPSIVDKVDRLVGLYFP